MKQFARRGFGPPAHATRQSKVGNRVNSVQVGPLLLRLSDTTRNNNYPAVLKSSSVLVRSYIKYAGDNGFMFNNSSSECFKPGDRTRVTPLCNTVLSQIKLSCERFTDATAA